MKIFTNLKPDHMKLKHLIFLSLLLAGLSSCRSYKELTMMRNLTVNQPLAGVPGEQTEHVIRALDNLFVSIVSANEEMNSLYNPALSSTGPRISQNLQYDELPIQYLYGYQVTANGDLVLPLIGTLHVEGLSLKDCETAVKKKAEEQLKECSVKVRLLNYKVTVTGEVARPGVYYNYNYNFTVMDAISMANGITDFASIENVTILRTTDAGTQTYVVDLTSSESLKSKGYFIEPNDIVIVKPDNYKNVRLRTPVYTLFLSTLATALLLLNYLKD